MQINNLVFEGGGIKGIAYAGALKCLEEQGLTKNVHSIAGSSAGAITAGLLAVGYNGKELEDTLVSIDYESIKDTRCCFGKCWGVLKRFGIFKGNAFEQIYANLLAAKTGDPDITFKQIKKRYGINLCITATNLNKYKLEYFCTEKTPDMPLKSAVRVSMSVPFLFEVKNYPSFNGDVYVDGGLLNNYPINLFKDDMEHTLGFKLVTPDEQENEQVWYGNHEINNIKDYSMAVVNSMLLQIERGWIKDQYWERTITIDAGILDSFEFDISNETAKKLYDNGYNSTKAWIDMQKHYM